MNLWATLLFASTLQISTAYGENTSLRAPNPGPSITQTQIAQNDALAPPRAESAPRLIGEAEEAFNRGDYDLAITRAREAIRQKPDAVGPRRVLIYALEATGHLKEAQREIEAFSHLNPVESATEVGQIRNRIAHKYAEKVYSALERNDNADAAENAREAVRLNPDENSYHLLLTLALLKKSDYKDAVASASDALERDGQDVNAMAMRAFARQKLGDVVGANSDFDLALEQDGQPETNKRSIRLIAIDAAIAARDPGRAQKLLAGMDKDDDAVRRRWSALTSGQALAMPVTECQTTADGQTCSVAPGEPTADAGYQAASEAYEAFAARDYATALAKAREAARLSPENDRYAKLLATVQAAPTMGAPVASSTARRTGRLPVSRPAPGYEEARRIGALIDERRDKEAKAAYDHALLSGKLHSLAPLDLAYLSNRIGDKATAYEQFGIAHTRGELHDLQLVDAAYAARRMYDNEQAIELLKQAIDETGATLAPQDRFNLRREVATLSRSWGAYLNLSHGSTGALPGSPISSYAVDQFGSELYWRPPGIGYRDGAVFELFGRDFMTLHDQLGGVTGFPTAQPSLGVRWKPLSNYNLVFEAAQLFRIGTHSRSDTMLRMAYSDGAGTDLHVDVPSWWVWQGYGEIGRYLETQQTFGSFEIRAGRSYRLDAISDRLVVTPFVSVAGNLDSLLKNELAAGVGPGFNFRWWFREDRYTAPMSYLDMDVQYKFKLSKDDRAEGFFANLTVAY